MIEELKTAAWHEGIVLVFGSSILAVAWFCLSMLSVDPPFLGWFLVFLGLLAVETIDYKRYGLNGVATLVMALRCLINCIVAIIGLSLSGIFVIVTGPPPPKGPFSLVLTVTAFMAMIGSVRAIESVMVLTTRFDWNAIKEWWRRGNGSDVAAAEA